MQLINCLIYLLSKCRFFFGANSRRKSNLQVVQDPSNLPHIFKSIVWSMKRSFRHIPLEKPQIIKLGWNWKKRWKNVNVGIQNRPDGREPIKTLLHLPAEFLWLRCSDIGLSLTNFICKCCAHVKVGKQNSKASNVNLVYLNSYFPYLLKTQKVDLKSSNRNV